MGASPGEGLPKTPRGSFLGILEESVGEVILTSLLVSVQGRILDTQVLVGRRLAGDSKGVGVEASSTLL